MQDCIFCKISRGEIPAKIIYQDEQVCAFEDADPQAPVHILLVPINHITSVDAITPENSKIVAHIYEVIANLSKKLHLEKGYRVVTNCGKQGGQTVLHLHFHLLGGRNLGWPPG